MTSLRPYWCPKTMKRGPCWCPKPILWELNSFPTQTLSFVPINLHRCWSREWKHYFSVVFGDFLSFSFLFLSSSSSSSFFFCAAFGFLTGSTGSQSHVSCFSPYRRVQDVILRYIFLNAGERVKKENKAGSFPAGIPDLLLFNQAWTDAKPFNFSAKKTPVSDRLDLSSYLRRSRHF